MKAYTDLEQSRKLAKILPLESADMRIGNYVGKSGKVDGTNVHYYTKGESFGAPEIIYAWSLAALLDVLPDEVGDNHYLTLDKEGKEYCCCYEDINGNSFKHTFANNPIDACYEMIIKLHEQNLL